MLRSFDVRSFDVRIECDTQGDPSYETLLLACIRAIPLVTRVVALETSVTPPIEIEDWERADWESVIAAADRVIRRDLASARNHSKLSLSDVMLAIPAGMPWDWDDAHAFRSYEPSYFQPRYWARSPEGTA